MVEFNVDSLVELLLVTVLFVIGLLVLLTLVTLL